MRPVQRILEVVDDYEEHNGFYRAFCPAHNDRNTPNLDIKAAEDGTALFVCRAGCTQADVLAALERRGLKKRDLFAGATEEVSLNGSSKGAKSASGGRERLAASYLIKDASGHLVAIHERWESQSGKRFLWKHPSGEYSRRGEIRPAGLPLYGSEFVANWPQDRGIVLVEGEKPADALRHAGLRALGTVTGASGTHDAEALEVLAGRRVILWPDADQAGREHMSRHAGRLQHIAAAVHWYEWEGAPEKGDAADHPAVVGGNRARLGELAAELKAAPAYDPIASSPGGKGHSDPIPQDLSHANGHAPDLSGEEVLDRLVEFVRRFVVLTDEQADLLALWIVHTHAFGAADTTPYLDIGSAEKRSGKTRLLEVLSLLVAGPWLTGRVTAAVLVRKVAAETPTLLLDESDAAFKGDKEYTETLRGVLNAGFRRGGVTSLCVGQGANLSYRDFPVYSPKAIAGIGKLPDTIADRAVQIELRRRAPSERVERFRQRKVEPKAVPLHSAVAAWAAAHLEGLAEAEPDLPDELDDRAQDIIEPLLAIADELGGEWPERSRKAAVALLTGEEREDSESLGVRLLRDVRSIFDEESADRLATGRLLEGLHAMEDAPWGSLRGEPLDSRGLARLLKPYGVKPQQLRIAESKVRGYPRAAFEDAWSRYVPDTPKEAVHPVHPVHPADRADSGVPDKERVPDAESYPVHQNPHKNADVPDVPLVPHNPDPGASGDGDDALEDLSGLFETEREGAG